MKQILLSLAFFMPSIIYGTFDPKELCIVRAQHMPLAGFNTKLLDDCLRKSIRLTIFLEIKTAKINRSLYKELLLGKASMQNINTYQCYHSKPICFQPAHPALISMTLKLKKFKESY